MKSLAYIGTFILGAFAGGTLLFTGLCSVMANRTNNPIDDSAVVYEDEDIRVVRCVTHEPNDKCAVAMIVYKNNF
jgi:hypothetical protein